MSNVRCKFGMPTHDRYRASAPSFVRRLIVVRASKRERRNNFHGKAGRVIVEHYDSDIGSNVRNPLLRFLETGEDTLPVRLFRLTKIKGRADSGDMGAADPRAMILAVLIPIRLTAIAFNRPTAFKHHIRIFLLGAAGHNRWHLREGKTVRCC